METTSWQQRVPWAARAALLAIASEPCVSFVNFPVTGGHMRPSACKRDSAASQHSGDVDAADDGICTRRMGGRR